MTLPSTSDITIQVVNNRTNHRDDDVWIELSPDDTRLEAVRANPSGTLVGPLRPRYEEPQLAWHGDVYAKRYLMIYVYVSKAASTTTVREQIPIERLVPGKDLYVIVDEYGHVSTRIAREYTRKGSGGGGGASDGSPPSIITRIYGYAEAIVIALALLAVVGFVAYRSIASMMTSTSQSE